MIQVTRYIRHGAAYVHDHPQFLLTLSLICIIPVAFLVSGQQFLNAARVNQERLEKDRIGLLHDAFIAIMEAENYDAPRIQERLLDIATQNPDITQFEIVKKDGSRIYRVNALNQSLVDTDVEDAALYRLSLINPFDSVIAPYAESGIRYWRGFRNVVAEDGTEYFIFTETSLRTIDELFAANIQKAYLWLGILLLIIMALLVRHMRLIDYSYLYREMKTANDTKDLFANMIAHELRAPLTAIRGYASLIREDTAQDEKVRVQASRIEDSAARLVLVVSDLLDVARIQSGKLAITKASFDVASLVTDVTDSLHPLAEEKQITIVTSGVRSGVMIVGDEKRLFQALTNVISNALKYTKQGKVTVTVESFSDRVELRIADTGMGISSGDQKNLFTPFFRVENSDMKTITGTGLGMWITKQIIDLMGGSIGVESIRGVGTHVVITLPLS